MRNPKPLTVPKCPKNIRDYSRKSSSFSSSGSQYYAKNESSFKFNWIVCKYQSIEKNVFSRITLTISPAENEAYEALIHNDKDDEDVIIYQTNFDYFIASL